MYDGIRIIFKRFRWDQFQILRILSNLEFFNTRLIGKSCAFFLHLITLYQIVIHYIH